MNWCQVFNEDFVRESIITVIGGALTIYGVYVAVKTFRFDKKMKEREVRIFTVEKVHDLIVSGIIQDVNKNFKKVLVDSSNQRISEFRQETDKIGRLRDTLTYCRLNLDDELSKELYRLIRNELPTVHQYFINLSQIQELYSQDMLDKDFFKNEYGIVYILEVKNLALILLSIRKEMYRPSLYHRAIDFAIELENELIHESEEK